MSRIHRSSTYAPQKSSAASASVCSSQAVPSSSPRLPTCLIPSTRPTTVFSTSHTALPAPSSLTTLKLTSENLTSLRYIGQFNTNFLVCTLHNRLIYFDQHAICERKLLNHYIEVQLEMREVEKIIRNDYNMKVCLSHEVASKIDYENVKKTMGEFHSKRIPSPNNSVTICVKKYPKLRPELTSVDVQKYILTPDQLILSRLKSNACRDAVMMGDTIEYERGKSIVEGMRGEEFWYVCAHGRPSCSPGEVFRT
ncbi:hypothetical protein TrLO_g2118 [Triparma laevis f. longispina]|uniref:MutL C-terminal dimerisation domain-containing protein n=1 Tax=Triparma laevis f. longispina TaxID=1714387 RepID=A0A9W7FL81_9STRA|nr:hypothetical protein TrLO_g2118 [Triparma laevis f. longispina]